MERDAQTKSMRVSWKVVRNTLAWVPSPLNQKCRGKGPEISVLTATPGALIHVAGCFQNLNISHQCHLHEWLFYAKFCKKPLTDFSSV